MATDNRIKNTVASDGSESDCNSNSKTKNLSSNNQLATSMLEQAETGGIGNSTVII